MTNKYMLKWSIDMLKYIEVNHNISNDKDWSLFNK